MEEDSDKQANKQTNAQTEKEANKRLVTGLKGTTNDVECSSLFFVVVLL